jgi:hypothetical protein
MIDAFPAIPFFTRVSQARYAASRVLTSAAALLIPQLVTLPVLVYLLGGDPGQIVVYAIVAGIAGGLAGPVGTVVARVPDASRVVIVALLAIQALGFIFAVMAGLGADGMSNDSLLRLAAIAYLLLTIPGSVLGRIGEQGHEFRRAASATFGGILPAVTGTLVAGLMVWRLFEAGGMGSDDLLARVLVGGALLATAGAWIAHYPTILAAQLPHPARPMPQVQWPGLFSNRPLLRYVGFHAIAGLARFADPFLLVGVITLISPGVAWIGGAVLAFAIGDALARTIATRAFRPSNVRGVFIVSGFLHALAFIVVAFAGDVLGSSVISDRDPSESWRDWGAVLAALALGASYQLMRTGHVAYIRSITSPGTRDLSLTATGIVAIVTAFAPLIAVQILDARDVAALLQIGVGASIISLLATALIVPTYAPPRRPWSAWGLRR